VFSTILSLLDAQVEQGADHLGGPSRPFHFLDWALVFTAAKVYCLLSLPTFPHSQNLAPLQLLLDRRYLLGVFVGGENINTMQTKSL
jgi:hypothetical protein